MEYNDQNKTLKITEAYVVVLWFLEELYDLKLVSISNNQDDALGIFDIISSMDPFIWNPDQNGNYGSIDGSKGQQWKEALESIGINTSAKISGKETFEGMIAYIRYYQKEFCFDIQDALDLLLKMKETPKKYKALWETWSLYLKHSGHYPVTFERDGFATSLIKKKVNRPIVGVFQKMYVWIKRLFSRNQMKG